MKRDYSQGTVEKHHGYWRAVLRWQDGSGTHRRITKSTGIRCYPDRTDAKTGKKTPDNRGKATAETFMRRWRDELVAADADEDAEGGRPISFAGYVEKYIDDKGRSRAVRTVTVKGYRSHLKKIIGTPIGSMDIRDIAPRDIMAWERDLAADGLSPATLSHIHVFAKQVCAFARKMGDLASNPFDLVDAPKRKSKPVNSLTRDEVIKMNRALEGFGASSLAVGSKLALMTGMRQAEICALRWLDIDRDGRQIRVAHALTRSSGRYIMSDPKTASSVRTIPFGDALASVLDERREEMREERASLGLRWDDALFVIGSPITGKPYSPQVLGHEWHAFARTAGLMGTQGVPPRFHDLRHSFATLAISSSSGGIDVKTVSAILGHSNAAMTLNVYADALADSKRDGMETMDGLLSVM